VGPHDDVPEQAGIEGAEAFGDRLRCHQGAAYQAVGANLRQTSTPAHQESMPGLTIQHAPLAARRLVAEVSALETGSQQSHTQ
jgi:hypothetical protein